MIPSPDIWHYRNKVDPSFGRKWYPEPPSADFERESVLGFKCRGQWRRLLDIRECRIAPQGFDALVNVVRDWMHEHDLRTCDTRSHRGFLRCLLVRVGKRTGQRMVVLITSEGSFDQSRSFVDTVQAVFPSTLIARGISRRSVEGAFADELETLHGGDAIEERLEIADGEDRRSLRFHISPFGFFQTNSAAAERLYALVRRWVRAVAPRYVYDLYGGAGAIALTCADLVEHVWSVDNAPDTIDDGEHNVGMNQVENITFALEKVKNYLLVRLTEGGLPDGSAAIVDPSRAGVHPKALRRLIDLSPPDILYVSCNPGNLARELPHFLKKYGLVDVRAVDLFPHTKHIEAVAWLSLRKDARRDSWKAISLE